jgi:hypothetical protein
MFRTAAALVGVAFFATAANAADIKVSTVDKSPAQLRAAVSDAAFKACREVYSGDVFAVYERDGCVRDTVSDAMAKVSASTANATNTVRVHAVLASR